MVIAIGSSRIRTVRGTPSAIQNVTVMNVNTSTALEVTRGEILSSTAVMVTRSALATTWTMNTGQAACSTGRMTITSGRRPLVLVTVMKEGVMGTWTSGLSFLNTVAALVRNRHLPCAMKADAVVPFLLGVSTGDRKSSTEDRASGGLQIGRMNSVIFLTVQALQGHLSSEAQRWDLSHPETVMVEICAILMEAATTKDPQEVPIVTVGTTAPGNSKSIIETCQVSRLTRSICPTPQVRVSAHIERATRKDKVEKDFLHARNQCLVQWRRKGAVPHKASPLVMSD